MLVSLWSICYCTIPNTRCNESRNAIVNAATGIDKIADSLKSYSDFTNLSTSANLTEFLSQWSHMGYFRKTNLNSNSSKTFAEVFTHVRNEFEMKMKNVRMTNSEKAKEILNKTFDDAINFSNNIKENSTYDLLDSQKGPDDTIAYNGLFLLKDFLCYYSDHIVQLFDIAKSTNCTNQSKDLYSYLEEGSHHLMVDNASIFQFAIKFCSSTSS